MKLCDSKLSTSHPSININGSLGTIKRPLNSLMLTLFVLVGLLVPSLYVSAAVTDTSNRNALEYFFHQSFNNLSEELELAREENKTGIFVMFNDPDCPWCAKMKATVLNRITVQDFYRKHFRVIHIDTRGDTVLTDFQGNEMPEKDFSLKVNRVRATPVFIFFGLDGKKILRYTGATRNLDEFMWLGEFVTTGAYKTTKFSKYKRKRRSAN